MDDSRSSRDRIELYVEGETMHLNMDVLVKRGQNGYYVKCILSQIASDIIQGSRRIRMPEQVQLTRDKLSIMITSVPYGKGPFVYEDILVSLTDVVCSPGRKCNGSSFITEWKFPFDPFAPNGSVKEFHVNVKYVTPEKKEHIETHFIVDVQTLEPGTNEVKL